MKRWAWCTLLVLILAAGTASADPAKLGTTPAPMVTIKDRTIEQVQNTIVGMMLQAGKTPVRQDQNVMVYEFPLSFWQSVPDAGIPVLHWFSGTQRQLKRAIDQGCWFSVGNQMCSSAKGKEIVKAIPVDRLITETDGPFCQVRGKPIDPGDVGGALGLLSDYRGESVEAVAMQVLECFMTLRRSL